MIFAAYVLIVTVAGVCWLTALYDLDRRRCATARGAGDLDAKGKGAERADSVSLAVADRRSRDAGPSRRSRSCPGSGGPHMQNAPPRTPCRDAARRDAH